MTISPDNLNIAVVDEEEGIVRFTLGYAVPGDAVLFSTTSDAAAVWDDCQLIVYTLGYPRLYQELFQPERVAAKTIEADDCTSYHRAAAWNDDGRLLAYSDAAGIWLWDVFTPDSQPELLVPAADDVVPVSRYFSPGGRLLNFAMGDTVQHIDVVSGQLLPNGIVSPDDRLMVNLDSPETSSGYDICSLAPFRCDFGAPMYLRTFDEESGEVVVVYSASEIGKIRWQDSSTLLVVACTPEITNFCGIYLWGPRAFGQWQNTLISEGFSFDYDTANRATVILRDATTLIIDGRELTTADWFDTGMQDVVWMPSLFYHD